MMEEGGPGVWSLERARKGWLGWERAASESAAQGQDRRGSVARAPWPRAPALFPAAEWESGSP